MLSVAVHKDIGEYTEKVVGKLSARTLACTAGGLASSVATAATLNLALGVPVDAATLPVMAASMPFWLMGFWRPKGLTAERYLAILRVRQGVRRCFVWGLARRFQLQCD